MKVVSSNTELTKSLERAFGEECPDLVFVDTTSTDSFDLALDEAKSGKPVIVLGFKSPAQIVDDSRVRRLMCKKNAGYLQAPFVLDKAKELYTILQRGKTIEEDVFAQELQARYDRFQAKPDRDISLAFVTAFGSPESLADILRPPSQRYRCD